MFSKVSFLRCMTLQKSLGSTDTEFKDLAGFGKDLENDVVSPENLGL